MFLEISQNSHENTFASRSFPMNFVKFLGTPFFTEHLWWLLLESSLEDLFNKRHQCWSLPFNQVAGWRPATLFKETPAQVSPYEFWCNFKEHLLDAAPACDSFRNHVHESVNIMRGLHKWILSTNKTTMAARNWWKDTVFILYQISALRERNQTCFELSRKIF